MQFQTQSRRKYRNTSLLRLITLGMIVVRISLEYCCLNKETTPDQLIDTIRRVAHGQYPINESLITRPSVANKVLQQFQELSLQSETVISPLTRRETEVLDYIAQGYLNKQIAAELDISEQTIKNHVTSILRKLNANARTEAVVLALKQGIITLD